MAVKGQTRTRVIVILAIISWMLMISPAAAGDGDASGGGQGNPLSLTASSPADGQKDVSLSVQIKLVFSKNVINMSVQDKNRQCLALYAAGGSRVPAEVIMADDQMEPEKKRDVILRPLQQLKPGTSYTVKISPEMKAKSGSVLGKLVTITFVTSGAAQLPAEKNENQVSAELPKNVEPPIVAEEIKQPPKAVNDQPQLKPDGADKAQKIPVPINDAKPTGDEKAAPGKDSKKSGFDWKLAAAGTVVGAAGFIYYRWRRKGI